MKVTKRTLEKNELEMITNTQGKMIAIKNQIGDLEIRKQGLMYQYSETQQALSKISDTLRSRYGENAVIDVKTGEVKYPNENEDK